MEIVTFGLWEPQQRHDILSIMKSILNVESALNWLGVIVMTAVAALSLNTMHTSGQTLTPQWWAVAGLFVAQVAAFVVFLSPWATNNRSRMLGLFWLQAPLILVLYLQIDMGYVAILGIVWVVQAAELFPIRKTIALTLVAILAFSLGQITLWPGQLSIAMTNTVTLGLFHLFALIVIHRFHRERELREHTANLNRELIATRELLSQHSRESERLRIARDLHDLLGHHMTALILQLEVATHITEGKGQEKVEQSLALAKLLLSDLRTAVSELRDDDSVNLKTAIEKLVADIPDLQVDLDLSAATVVKEVAVAETLLRCTQEALTNVLRHSNATRCRIGLAQFYNEFFLTIEDNGHGNNEITPGNGLIGMRERLAEFSGEVSWQQQEEGFLVQVRLPVEAGA